MNFTELNMKRIAVIYTWPNTPFKNAEYEVLKRIEIAAKNLKIKLDIISSNGFLLDDEYYETKNKINEQDYEFMISVHYDDIKKLDIFSYYTLWVPPEITLQYEAYPRIKKNIISNDDYLIYDDGGQLDHLKTILIDSPRYLEGHSELYATPPLSSVLKPKLDDPCLFYCGINWEKLIGKKPRHAELFNMLTKTDWINIYGPHSTWNECNRYKNEIPFDGISIIKEINKCGVVLVISSLDHYRAGSVTNRIYEGVAGGAVIISDTNFWVKKIFGDSVLYFDFDINNPMNMFNQIKQHMNWIRKNKVDAKKLAEKAQKIFLEKLVLEKQLSNVISNHPNRLKKVAEALYSLNNKTKTLLVSFLDEKRWEISCKNTVINLIADLDNQIEDNVSLAICANKNFVTEIKEILKIYCINISSIDKKVTAISKANKRTITIFLEEFYDKFFNKLLTRGQSLYKVISDIKHDYLMLLSGNEYIYKDHITTLKRRIEEDHSFVSYSGYLVCSDVGEFGYPNLDIIPDKNYHNFYSFLPNARFLFDSRAESILKPYFLSNIDGSEVYLLLNLIRFKYQGKISFSKRLSLREKYHSINFTNSALPISYQINMVNGITQFDTVNCEFIHYDYQDAEDRKLKKFLIKRFYKKISQRIFFHKVRQTFTFGKQRKKINKEIKDLKEQKNILKKDLNSRLI